MTSADARGPGLGGGRSSGEAELWRALRAGETSARLRLFDLHYPFARRLARKRFYDRSGTTIEFAELCQLASAGLLEAIDRFDPELGASFQAYAALRVDGSMLDGIAKMSEMREQISFRNRIRAERARSLSVTEAQAQEMAAVDALHALIEAAVGLAIGFMLQDSGDYIAGEPYDPAPSAYESVVWKDTLRRLAAEIENLPEREATIVRQHYLNGLSFDQIGALLGVSKGRVSQLHKAAIGLLRKRLSRAGDFKIER